MYNLRKAHKLQECLREVMQDLDLPPMTIDAMTRADSWEATANEALSKHADRVQERLAIAEAITDIRNGISAVNAKVGINLILGELRGLDQMIHILDVAVMQDIRDDNEVIEKRLEMKNKELAKTDRIGYGSNAVEVSVFTEAWKKEHSAKLKKLKKKKRNLEDKLLNMNASSNVDLSQSTLDLLAKYDLD